MNKNLDYTITRDVLSEGSDGRTQWFQPRAAILPPNSAVIMMTRSILSGSDLFTAIQSMQSDDGGRTWSKPVAHPATLGRHLEPEGTEVVPCDMTPAWHAASGKLLATGHTCRYLNGKHAPPPQRRETPYAIYDPDTRAWSPWRHLDLPDRDGKFFNAGAGCTQRVDLANGDILLPIYFIPRAATHDSRHNCYYATVVRCGFDGATLRYLEQGDELTCPDPRGFCEPSLVRFQGLFYLTLRNDVRGYVTVGEDGLHFQPPRPWTFDDRQELGSYNTQQHWVAHSEGLFLVYTRRGADNDHVIRHRAPLFMARVDTERLCVLRETERILLPEKGAQFGNFGTVNASADESWVTDAEGLQGDAKKPMDIARTIQRGAANRLYLCRLRWNRPNRLA
ncbi:MAG: sialidase family protein [Kiritimatiellae bacterium]|nr:sialidase family protein [Kiritimatiellia bacterium]